MKKTLPLYSYNTTPDVVAFLRSQGITKLYHFTDMANIQSIIDNGGLYSWRACENKGISIKRPGGSSTSRSLDSYRGLENYVRLSFTRNHPMMYVAQNEGRIVNPIVLEIDIAVAGLTTTLFADRNAVKNGAIITAGYNGAKNIHFSTITQPNHFNLSPEEKEFYQAEVLVLEKIPLSYITNIDAYKPKVLPSSPSSSPKQIGTISSVVKPTKEQIEELKSLLKPWEDIEHIKNPLQELAKRREELNRLLKQIERESEQRRIKEEQDQSNARAVLIGFIIGGVILLIGFLSSL